MTKCALITGVTGQDGAYLAELLLSKNYDVYGMVRRSSTDNKERLNHLKNDIHLIDGDLADGGNITRMLNTVQPEEIYNLGAQSHVGTSFDMPEFTANVDGLGTLRLLESMRTLDMKDTKFYQASSSEIFGNSPESPLNESSSFHPCSPYGVAKLYAYWTVINYRQAYDFFTCNGILFNHESPVRGSEFVTRKITKAVASIHHGSKEILKLGNLNAKRDWGHARDYVRGMWMMMQAEQAGDYVLATGKARSVREFVEAAFTHIDIQIEWQGENEKEQGINLKTGDVLVKIDPDFYRSNELHHLVGDASKAKDQLGWSPEILFNDLITEMVTHDIKAYEK
jgi:GDPmannose 4,6-dehydratase